MSKIGIIDADLIDKGTKHPNLALMKLSGYYKEQGDNVNLLHNYNNLASYDSVFISKVFNFTKFDKSILLNNNIHIGGTGFYDNGGNNLPDKIEHHMPDYDLYNNYINMKIANGVKENRFNDYKKYSIGFTTRGCFRKCSFCVNKKYDHAFKHSPINEFYDSARPYIYLWDDNFLAFSGWEQILNEIEETKKPFQFRQGLDLRLMTEHKAERLANTKYHGDYIFAFDHIEDRELIENKLNLWGKYCKKETKLYVLCAYDTQDEVDIANTFERIKILMRHKCLPYIMRYESYNNSKYKGIYTQLARWCNQPQFFKKLSFREFAKVNQNYHKNKDTECATYRVIKEFEKVQPEIANKYYDLKFEDAGNGIKGIKYIA